MGGRSDKIGILVDWYIGKLVSETNDYAEGKLGRAARLGRETSLIGVRDE